MDQVNVEARPETPALEMSGIVKRFPGVLASDRVDFSLGHGEVHALLGENGAGKTTLMNILYGLYRPDAGQVLVHGRKAAIYCPRDAIDYGIGMVHQHFMLVPVMTVVENMIIGHEITRCGGFLDLKKAAGRVREISGEYGLDIDPQAVVGGLSLGLRQRVEILKALYRQAEILILDEPTSVLTPDESEGLFHTLTALARGGKSVVFITHKLKEVMNFADRITVLRAGRVVGRLTPAETSEAHLAELMVGREVSFKAVKKEAKTREAVLKVHGLTALNDRGAVAVSGLSLEVRAGEVYGLAGVQGNGQTELVEVITGLRRCVTGKVQVNEVDLTNRSVRKIYEQSVAHVPEDRHTYGMVGGFSIADNLILNVYHRPPFSGKVTINRTAVWENASRILEEYDIRAPGVFTPAGSLSGGNQQRMVVAREFSRSSRLLIVVQPTRGLDVGSAEYIHQRIIEKREAGCAILLVSAELDEILSLSDRIGVMYKGGLIAEAPVEKAGRENLGLWMAGVVPEKGGHQTEEAVDGG